MKIQEIFNEYIELLPYMAEPKEVFLTTTLYNSYIKNVFGNKEVSILLLTDYQNFTNELLSKKFDDGHISIGRVQQIVNILISISRFAIKSNYEITDNLPLQIKINANYPKFEDDLINIQLAIELGENFLSFMETAKKVSSFQNVA